MITITASPEVREFLRQVTESAEICDAEGYPFGEFQPQAEKEFGRRMESNGSKEGELPPMNFVTAPQAVQEFFRPIRESAEVRDGEGNLLGHFRTWAEVQ